MRLKIPGTRYNLSSETFLRRLRVPADKVENLVRTGVEISRTHLSRAGLDKSYFKIFAIGFNKTATSSIHNVFLGSGLRAVHDTFWATPPMRMGYMARFRAFSDGPLLNDSIDFAAYDRAFPRSRFILNVRSLDEWIDSRIEHIRFMRGAGKQVDQEYWTDTPEAIVEWIRVRNRHHLDVMKYFQDRPDDLLVLNYVRDPDAVEKIAAFIDRPPLAAKPFHFHLRKDLDQSGLRNADMIMECLSGLGIPAEEHKFDLFCPSLADETERTRFPFDTEFLTDATRSRPRRNIKPTSRAPVG